MRKSIISVFVIMSIISVAGCTQDNTSGSPNIQIPGTCPNLENVTNYLGIDSNGRFYIDHTGDRLFDDWKLETDSLTACREGSQVGESINYDYCRGITADKIDANGNIIDTKKVTVVLSIYFNESLGKYNKTYITTMC